jgi:hypothetical protein
MISGVIILSANVEGLVVVVIILVSPHVNEISSMDVKLASIFKNSHCKKLNPVAETWEGVWGEKQLMRFVGAMQPRGELNMAGSAFRQTCGFSATNYVNAQKTWSSAPDVADTAALFS